ncbi:MAG: hypothetical protein AAFO29_12285, partial [Actinomycetota bacterium]
MPMLTRRSSPFFAALVVALTAAPLTAVSAQEVIDPPAVDDAIDQTTPLFATGPDAADRLVGDDTDELVARLETEPSLAVDRNGELLIVEPLRAEEDEPIDEEELVGDTDTDGTADDPETEPVSPRASDAAVAATFAMTSKPGALQTVVLDVDGHRTLGTRWNAARDGSAVGSEAIDSAPYDLDGDPTTLTE